MHWRLRFSPVKWLAYRLKHPHEPNLIIAVALYTVFIMYLCAVIGAGGRVWAVQVDGREVALVKEEKVARQALAQVVEQKSRELGRPVLPLEKVQIVSVRRSSPHLLDGRTLVALLDDCLTYQSTATGLAVNGEVKIILPDRQEAQRLLARLKARFSRPGEEVGFAEDVALVDVQCDPARVTPPQEALERVLLGGQTVSKYTVKEGDTAWDIARATGMTVEQIAAANPDIDLESLQIGQEISLHVVKPLVSVVATSRQSVLEIIPPEVKVEKDKSLLLGDSKVKQQGRPGKKEAVYEVVRVNGTVSERKLVAERIIEKPQPKIIAKGSRLLLASRSRSGDGRLAWPTVGSVVSPFGQRWGRMHEGVDISGGIGDPVVAAQSGTVIRAGWYSGYGKCVDVSHGDGVITRYGHLSRISVAVGQYVEKGQLIGRVGNTGRSTGPHLHFEVIVNGTPRNPMRYL
ncbi:MAG: peptidoglycan DD-metalloendopeptidase family protein [Bacillota bacterium]